MTTYFFAALSRAALATSTPAEEYDRTQTTLVAEIEGQYLPLVLKALSHRRMRGKRLDCYEVRVRRQEGEWRVYFAGHRDPMPADTETEIHVGHMPQNALCPDIGLIFDGRGRIRKVYGSRE